MKPARTTVIVSLVLLAALLFWVVVAVNSVSDLSDESAASTDPTGPETSAGEAARTGPVAVAPPTATGSTDEPTGEDTSEEPTGQETSAPSPSEQTSAVPNPDPPAVCVAAVEGLDVEDRVGQLFMLSKDSRTPVDDGFRALLDDTRPGHLLLLGETDAGAEAVAQLTAALREAAPTPDGVGVLIAADQEGGTVQRLQGPGFDRIPSAVEQSRMSDADLRAAATRWGEQLRAAGVDATLAPVADVVPADMVAVNEPIGRLSRQYGETAEAVQPKLAAFVEGMDEAGVATSLKHFPGLGRVVGNTDFTGGVVDTQIGRDDPGLQAFAGVEGELADMVMIATAAYDRIDPGVPAAFSSVVIEEMLRGDLGFDGVVIADDLGVAAQVAHVPPGERALRFLEAGGDIVINAAPGIHREMVDAVLEEVGEDPAFAEEVDAKVARILAMKERRGIADCG